MRPRSDPADQVIDSFASDIRKRLTQNESKSDERLSMDDLELRLELKQKQKKVSKQQCLQTFLESFNELTQQHIDSIKSVPVSEGSEVAESKDSNELELSSEEPTNELSDLVSESLPTSNMEEAGDFAELDRATDPIKDKSEALCAYFRDVKKFFERALKIYIEAAARESSLLRKGPQQSIFLSKIIERCQYNEIYYAQPYDTSVYKVVMPEEKFHQLKEGSGIFHYGSKAGAVAATTLASATLPFTTAWAITMTLFSFGEDYEKEKKNVKENMKRIAGPAAQYGYSCSIMSISSQWIEGIVRANGTIKLANKNFVPDDSNNKVLYFLDANSPEKIWQHGIAYQDSGALIYFHKSKNAFECAAIQNDGSLFHTELGWKFHNEYTEEERSGKQVRKSVKQAKSDIAKTTNLPNDIVQEIGEYLGYRRNR